MITITKTIRWLLVITCALEGLLFLLLSYIAFDTGRRYHAEWFPGNLRQNILFLFIGLSFVLASYLLFRRHPSARFLSAFLLCGITVWILIDAFSVHPPVWSALRWAAPSGIAFLFLLSVWTAQGTWRVEKSA